MIPAQDGYFENTETGETVKEKDVPRIKHTAKCVSTDRGEHAIRYCDAKLNADHSITLYFHEFSTAYDDNLAVTISGSQFRSQFWTAHLIRREADLYVWTTTKQTLILDKKEYRPGDMLKGRIEFKCVEKNLNPKHKENDVITVRGVFKTVLQ